MITTWQIYWITRLDEVIAAMVGSMIILAIVGIVLGIITLVSFIEMDGAEHLKKYIKPFVIFWLVPFVAISILSIFIPSTKTAVAIYAIPKIANNETLQKIPENTAKFLNEKLKAWIADTLETSITETD